MTQPRNMGAAHNPSLPQVQVMPMLGAMSAESGRGERVFLWFMGVNCASAYGYAFLFETPGQISRWGVLALGLGGATMLFLAAYLMIKLYQWLDTRKTESEPTGTNESAKR